MPPEVLQEAASIVQQMVHGIRLAGGAATARAAFELALSIVERGERTD